MVMPTGKIYSGTTMAPPKATFVKVCMFAGSQMNSKLSETFANSMVLIVYMGYYQCCLLQNIAGCGHACYSLACACAVPDQAQNVWRAVCAYTCMTFAHVCMLAAPQMDAMVKTSNVEFITNPRLAS